MSACPRFPRGPLDPELRARYPRGFVHFLPNLLDGQLDTESDAVQDVLEVGLLVDLKLRGDGQCSATSWAKATPFAEGP